MNEYRYNLTSTENSSNQYGKCDICGKHATEVYHQTEERKYTRADNNTESWTQNKCNSYFGHKECLESKRR